MRLLVVGANGLLGSNIVSAGQERGWNVSGTYHSTQPAFNIPLVQFDLQAYDTFENILGELDPDVVVNCAAMTDVDGCERHPERVHLLNAEAPGGLADYCEADDIEFVHLSTDYVFDGTSRTPYNESTEPNPVQVYGKSKLKGERYIRSEMEKGLIIRLSFVWGIHQGNGDLTGFPAWVRDQLETGENLSLFTNQWITPTRAGQAAETLLNLIEQDAEGVFHIACKSCVTPYKFGKEVAQYNNNKELLIEGSMADIERNATRPKYSCLDVENVESTLGRPQPTLREDVEAAWNEIGYI